MGKKQASKHSREQRKMAAKYRRKRDARVTAEYGKKAHMACGRKARYETQEQAMAWAVLRMNKGAPNLTTYKCPYCGGWHLTSKG